MIIKKSVDFCNQRGNKLQLLLREIIAVKPVS